MPYPTLNPSLPETMKAVRFYAPGDARYETVPLTQPGPGEMLIRIEAAATCGTDLKCYKRGHPVLLSTLPSPFGHEGAGTVVAQGAGVTRFQLGDRVVAANSAPCYDCFFCKKNQANLCEHLDLLNGTYAEYLCLPANIVAHNTYLLPPDLSCEQAALTEPLAVSLRCVMETPVKPGDRVAVLGVGAIGQMIIRLASWRGAEVTAFGRNPDRLALAKHFGHAVETVSLRDGLPAAESHRGAHGFDVVIEAIGLPEIWAYAVELVRRGGVVNWFAGCEGQSRLSLDTRRIHYDEIRLMSLFHHTPAYFAHALALQGEGVIDLSPLISNHLTMSQFATALQQVEQGRAVKVILIP